MAYSIDWQLFLSTFLLIFVAELPDKTAFASLFLATSHHPVAVFIGAAVAFLIQSIVAVAFGRVLNLLPPWVLQYGSSGLFLVFAVMMWRRPPDAEEAEGAAASGSRFWRSVATAFIAIFIAEWGDLTQLATATLEAKYGATLTILLAATLALWSVTAIGVAIGHHAKKLINPAIAQRVAAVAMVAVAIYLFLSKG